MSMTMRHTLVTAIALTLFIGAAAKEPPTLSAAEGPASPCLDTVPPPAPHRAVTAPRTRSHAPAPPRAPVLERAHHTQPPAAPVAFTRVHSSDTRRLKPILTWSHASSCCLCRREEALLP